jgi:hypothetical protein
MKRKTKVNQFNKIATGYHQLKQGEQPHPVPIGIKTSPIVLVPNKPEAEVLAECLDWLKKHRIWARRMNVGKGSLGASGFKTYGIVGAADITGILPDGRRLEIECKRGRGGILSEEQLEYKKAIEDNKGLYLVVHGVNELQHMFRCKGII